MKKSIAFFDFDGTITYKDTLLELIKYHKGPVAFYIGFILLSPVLIVFKAGLMGNWKAKQIVLKYFFNGTHYDDFQRKCKSFAAEIIPPLVRPKALAAIEDFKKNGVRVVVVTASAEDWVKPWCEKMNLECLATRLEVIENRLTGNISGLNCHGREKVERIMLSIDLAEYDDIHAYGDTKGDLDMLNLAHFKNYKPFCD